MTPGARTIVARRLFFKAPATPGHSTHIESIARVFAAHYLERPRESNTKASKHTHTKCCVSDRIRKLACPFGEDADIKAAASTV